MKKTISIKTTSQTIGGVSQLEVEAGTNGPKGGDSGSGSRTFVSIADGGGTVWNVTVVDEDGNENTFESPTEIAITLGGDSELDTMIRALEFALTALRGTAEESTQKSRDTTL
ncbi:hypothetical protein [Rhodoferax sp. UBA5149]|uniref:hypothetical protein n=1 Tax=Rhodoferax sp. UBA5149 TaxID=1947379 RepID=UPI0025F6E3BD|nr:hypothetical protein [Rhodoferax sp. UBA5149]